MFGPATPILRVADLRASVGYFVDILGFAIDWETPGFLSVSRDRCCIFLCEGGQGNPGAWTWTGVPDVEALHEELVARGAKIRQAPTNFPWALEIQVEDLDGNVLRFGSDPIEGRPYGPWKDMHGRLWAHRGGDRWEREE
ncbi:MAG TPA: glyoxalase superfamily protein [Thermoanaerobaculia bacterium]|nr:glyoxalase superfamily protein [Thermoanaerobaculia bacterium]